VGPDARQAGAPVAARELAALRGGLMKVSSGNRERKREERGNARSDALCAG